MWTLGQKAAKYHKLPSEFFPDLVDEWTCYCFDNAIAYFVSVIEDALTETVEIGMGNNKKHEAKYSLPQLLDDSFKLPRPQPEPRKAQTVTSNGLATVLAMAGQPNSGVKLWKYVPPEATLSS